MTRREFLTAALVSLGPLARAVEAAGAGASNSGPHFPAVIDSQIGGKRMRLVLTGTAMRTWWGLSVYAIGSYVQEGAEIRDAEALVRAPVVKRLHLAFERAVEGPKMAQSFREAIGMNHPAPAFATELTRLERYFSAHPARRGDHIWLTYLPAAGLDCQLAGWPGLRIEGESFAQAAWEVYLGEKNLGTAIRTGLTSRL